MCIELIDRHNPYAGDKAILLHMTIEKLKSLRLSYIYYRLPSMSLSNKVSKYETDDAD